MKQSIFRPMYPRQDHSEEEFAGLQRYIGNHQQDYRYQKRSHPKNMHSEQLHMQINRINSKLETICQERLGDLTSTSPSQIEKTLQLVQTLLGEIKKLQQAKAKLINQRRQTEQSLVQNEQTIDKLARQKKNIENEKQTINQNLKNIEKAYKQFMTKSQADKDELTKQNKQFINREKTFEAQFRKKQKFIKELQEGLKRFQDKDKSTFKNSFDVLQKLEFGPNIYDMYSTNGENQYGRLAKDAKDEVFRKLSDENQYLKDCLANVYKQLNIVLELKRETLKNKRGYDGQYQNCFDLNCFRPETLNLPQQWSRERLKQLNQNIQKFKQAIKIGDSSESRVDDRKQGCVNGIKQLIKSYKQVVETQDQLLNKVLLKSKEFKATQMTHLENKFSKALDSNQLDRAKRFVEQQAQYLQSKNMELEKTRKVMQMAMKKAEQNKKEMLKQRQAFEQQALEMRRSVEILPAVIEQELNKALN